MRLIILIFLASQLLFSCGKDRLRGDKEILEGKWRWVKTTVKGPSCNPPETPSDITPITKGREESVEFLKKGYFRTFINGEQQQEFKLKFESWFVSGLGYSFTIELNKDENFQIGGGVTSDTLMLGSFFIPVIGVDDGSCYQYRSYFVRE